MKNFENAINAINAIEEAHNIVDVMDMEYAASYNEMENLRKIKYMLDEAKRELYAEYNICHRRLKPCCDCCACLESEWA